MTVPGFDPRRRRDAQEPLPADLARLGDVLAAAAERQLRRRRALRRKVASVLAAGTIGVPLALALSPADLGPAVTPPSAVASSYLVVEAPRHIRDEAVPVVRPDCLDGRDCPIPEGADVILVLPENQR